jgi:ferredoxin-fold anticodon binding domain-containing protein
MTKLNTNLINFESYRNNYEELLENKENYFIFVRALTEKNYNLFLNVINPKGLKRSWKANHLDHRYSISQGFKDQIDPFLIAHPCNLQMLKARINKKKNAKCDITIEELLEGVNNFGEL